MVTHFVEGFLLGLSVSPTCLAFCTPVMAPFITSGERLELKGTVRLLGLFLMGRLLGYLIIGLLAGAVGSALFKGGESIYPAVITLLTGILLCIFGLAKNFPGIKWCAYFAEKKSLPAFTPLLGLLTGLNICPPFVAAIIEASAIGTIPGAVFYFAAFFIGTLVFFPVMAVWGWLTRWETARQIARVCLIIGGVWLIGKGMIGFAARIH